MDCIIYYCDLHNKLSSKYLFWNYSDVFRHQCVIFRQYLYFSANRVPKLLRHTKHLNSTICLDPVHLYSTITIVAVVALFVVVSTSLLYLL
jgi:hypothetical protein